MSDTQAAESKLEPNIEDFHIVGVGASAGGLEALEELFKSLPINAGMAYVVVQHLSPDFKSHMEELLARQTKLAIYRVENAMEVEPNSIYLIPPKMEMVISDRKLLLTAKAEERTLSHPIDQFFRSLASDVGRYAIGVILSGTGSDGSRGIREIHESGGLVIAQDEHSAKFDGMPMNAQATGVVDVVLPPDGIAEALVRYARDGLSPESLAKQELIANEAEGVERIFQLLQHQHGIDFSHYKASTVGRRIQRRVELLGMSSLESYLSRIENDPTEINDLYKDLLIGVTKFFRDREAFEIIGSDVMPSIFSRAKENQPIRMWVAGCASGEEAYSLAMLADEQMRARGTEVELKIFATDAHHVSLHTAAKGVYPEESLSELTEDRRSRYFQKKRDGYHVVPSLRKRIIFAPHNLIHDAPFTQMDLVSCRNMLIYLQPHAQKKVLSMFHFALKAGGTLFMGPSETPGDLEDEFSTINKRWRVFSKRRDVRLPLTSQMVMGIGMPADTVPRAALSNRVQKDRSDEESLHGIYDRLLDRKMPPSILVSEDNTILHVFAGGERFLRKRSGRPTSNLLELVDENLKTPITGALQHAIRKQDIVRYTGVEVEGENGKERLQISVEPIADPRLGLNTLFIEFMTDVLDEAAELVTTTVDLSQLSQDRIAGLESELRYSQENLQATVEEMETANEELQATNEELVASNEELQSTNEELHSVNEELYTVNAEHQRRVDELSEANSDMDNLLATTRVGVIFLDDELFIRRFTPEIGRLFHLVPQDLGRSIEGFAHHLTYGELADDLREVLRTQSEKEVDVQDREGVHYLLRFLPYRTGDEVKGVVLTLINVSRLKQAEFDLRRQTKALEAATNGIIIADGTKEDLPIVFTNPGFLQLTGYSEEEIIGKNCRFLQGEATNRETIAKLRTAISRREPCRVEIKNYQKDGTPFWNDLHVTPVFDTDGNLESYVGIQNDISESLNFREQLAEVNSRLEGILQSLTEGFCYYNSDWQYEYVNDYALKILGKKESDLIGRTLWDEYPDFVGTEYERQFRTVHGGGEPAEFEMFYEPLDTWFRFRCYPSNNGLSIFFKDITESRESESQLQTATSEARKLAAVVERCNDFVGITTPAGEILYINEAGRRMVGIAIDDTLRNKVAFDFIAEKDHKTMVEIAIPMMNKEGAWRGPISLKNFETSEQFPTLWNAFVLRDPEAEHPEVWVTVSPDYSDQNRLQEALKVSEQKATAANQAKSEFLANMSHEIRTPMSAVLGHTDILLKHLTDADNRQCALTIKRNGDHLIELINDILDLSRIEAGKLQVDMQPRELSKLLSDVQSLMQVRIKEGLELRVIAATWLPLAMPIDAKRLRQVLVNLVGNALKFTEKGYVEVRASYHGEREPSYVAIEVEDTGIGIEKTALTGLFEPFNQGDASVTRRYGGSGLGLAISSRLIDMMGGSLQVESQVGRGTTFTVKLPTPPKDTLELVNAIVDQPVQDNDSPTISRKLSGKLLLVDDRREMRHIGRHFLEEAGAKVATAADGAEAIEMVNAAESEGSPYRAIVIDMQMPVMDGRTAVLQLRADGYERPIIALTADAMSEDREKCLEIGCDDYLSKPIEAYRLVEAVGRMTDDVSIEGLIKLRRSRRQGDTATNTTAVRRQLVLIVDDSVDSAKATALLLKHEGFETEVEHTGAAALRFISNRSPAAVILDIGLPDADGRDVARGARDNGFSGMLIALSGRSEPDDFKESQAAGFTKHLVKPVDISVLTGVLTGTSIGSSDGGSKDRNDEPTQ